MFKRKDVLFILWLTFFTVVAWIGFSVYHIKTTSTLDTLDLSAIVPINPVFDTDTIQRLKTREKIEPLYKFSDAGQEEMEIPQDVSSPSAMETIPLPTINQDPIAISPDVTVSPQASTSP